jgi:hypothetical protein
MGDSKNPGRTALTPSRRWLAGCPVLHITIATARVLSGRGGTVRRKLAITTKQRLLTDSWTGDVDTVETAFEQLTANSPEAERCRVVFFEIVGDPRLHVNVTHQHQTRTALGWAGPASLPEGFVHNRRFEDIRPTEMIRQIREMVYAARL